MFNPSISELVARIRGSEPRLGSTRLVLVDGQAGAGKSTVTNRLAVALGGSPSNGAGSFRPDAPLAPSAPVQIVHGDDLYEGWGGLGTLDSVLIDQVLEPLAQRQAGGFRMWDWVEGQRTHEIAVPHRDYLIVEGVGVASPRARDLAVVTLFVEAPWATRLERGIARDHMAYADVVERWEAFELDERERHERTKAREAADWIMDGTAAIPDK